MKEDDSFFRAVFENTGTGMAIVEEDNTISLINKEMEALFGYSREEVEGRMSWTQLVAFEDDLRRMEKYHRLRRGDHAEEVPTKYETTMISKDGGIKSFMVNVDIIPGTGKSVASFIDISARKQAEEALEQSEQKFRNIFHTSSDSIFIHDLSGRYLEVNDVACDRLGYTREEFKQMSLMDINTPEHVPPIQQRIRKIKQKGQHVFETAHQRKNGEIVPVEISGRKIEYQGETSILSIARDISERKQAEQEKEGLQEQLRQAQKMKAIGTLAGGIAHDFNNILSYVLGYTELSMEEVEKNTILHQNLSQVLSAGNRAKELVKQILTFGREHGTEFKLTPLIPLVKETSKMIRSTLPVNIDVREDIHMEQAIVNADPTQLHQIFINLATNAKQAIGDKGGGLRILLEPVNFDKSDKKELPQLEQGSYVHIAFSDTGCGISKQDLDKIFEPYFTNKEKEMGTGLGLSVVHGIVKTHNGHISVESEEGRGSTFHVYLPLVEHINDRAPSQPQKRESLPSGSESILLVEDEQPILEMERQMLERLGYQVTIRSNGVEGLEAFRARPHKFDILVTDMMMPNMTGEVLARKAKEIRPDLPVILCTGFSEKVDYRNKKNLRIDELLMKPVTRIDMANTVRKVLDQAES